MSAARLQSVAHGDVALRSPRMLQRKCACGASARGGDQCDECKRKLQSKLAIGSVDDPLEGEADRIADRVMASSTSNAVRATPVHVQRAGGGNATTEAAPASVERTLGSSGRPLEPGVREDMERRFGHDFFNVRVHDDAQAARSAADVQSHAYAVGDHLVFNTGRYAPHTTEGRRLLAHELTHVLQQAQTPSQAPRHVRRGGLMGPSTKPHHCGDWTCVASLAACQIPDDKAAPSSTPSTSWTLVANIDTDVAQSTDIKSKEDIGHAFVEFSESNGDRYTYGHYPSKIRLPSDFKPEVPGCIAHPDHTHRSCVDMRVPFSLTQAEYTDALRFAQAWCAGQPYNLFSNNCTTFVDRIVAKAGKTLASSRGPVSMGKIQADNPNTLLDAYLSQGDAATWRQRVTGKFSGSYDYGAPGTAIQFIDFKLKTDDKNAVGGKYSYTGSAGNKVEGTIDGRLTFEVDPATKAAQATVKFDWRESSGTGKGTWRVSASGGLDGTWGRGTAESGMGTWTLVKQP